jgi:hypothetical protein
MVIDYRQGKARQEGLQISGPVQGGTIGNYHPASRSLGFSRRRDKQVFVRFDLGTFEGARGTGQGLFTHAAQYGNQGKLASHTVSIGFFMTGYEEFPPGFYEIYQRGRNLGPGINKKIFHMMRFPKTQAGFREILLKIPV